MDIRSVSSEETSQPVGLSSRIGLTPDAIPEVSTHDRAGIHEQGCPPTTPSPQPNPPLTFIQKPHWYVLRAAWGSEQQSCDYISQNSNDVELFWPIHSVARQRNGKIEFQKESLIPNIFFANATRRELEKFVYDNLHLPYLRFYYHKFHRDGELVHEPLIVPDVQLKSFRTIYDSAEDDIYIASDVIHKFTQGQMVRVIAGPFKGVVGRVARFKGQQRVGVVVGDLFTAVTAYIKNKYLEPV